MVDALESLNVTIAKPKSASCRTAVEKPDDPNRRRHDPTRRYPGRR